MFANVWCYALVLMAIGAVSCCFFLFDYQHFTNYFKNTLKKVCRFQNRLYICIR